MIVVRTSARAQVEGSHPAAADGLPMIDPAASVAATVLAASVSDRIGVATALAGTRPAVDVRDTAPVAVLEAGQAFVGVHPVRSRPAANGVPMVSSAVVVAKGVSASPARRAAPMVGVTPPVGPSAAARDPRVARF